MTAPTAINPDDIVLVRVDSIKITRMLSDGKPRLRQGTDIDQLADNIKLRGQLQPIIIERDYELVDGWRRLHAFKKLGWDAITAVFRDKMTDYLARAIELEANIMRQDMTWQERTHAIAELDVLKRKENPNWGQQQTGDLAGVPQPRVAEAIMLEKMIQLFPEIAEAKSVNQAMSWAKQKAALVIRVQDVKESEPQTNDVASRILLGDSVELIKAIPDESINLVLTDPPFGIGYDQRKEGTASSLTTYKDDDDAYYHILDVIPHLFRILKPNGWVVWFLGARWYTTCLINFRDAGFTMDEIPVIWDRSDGRTFTTRPDHYFNRAYDMAIMGFKGNPQMAVRSKNNILRFAPVSVNERELTVERPVELYQELIKRLTIEGEMVADFFVGSGSVLAAAASMKRKFIGCELDPERRAVAINKVIAYTPKE